MSRDIADLVNHLELTIHPNQTRPVLRALLNAIFFQRTLENVEPETFEVLDNHVVSGGDRDFEKYIDGKMVEFENTYVHTGASEGQLAVVFLQRKPKKGWFAVSEELIPWEEHLIHLHFSGPGARRRDENVSTSLQGALLRILKFCAERKLNVPPLAGAGEQSNVSSQIIIAPPSPAEIFAPSPPLHPTRLTSPPPAAFAATTPAIAVARDQTLPMAPPSYVTHGVERESKRSSSPAAIGYLEQAKEGFRAVRAGAGAVTGWGGRGSSAKGGGAV